MSRLSRPIRILCLAVAAGMIAATAAAQRSNAPRGQQPPVVQRQPLSPQQIDRLPPWAQVLRTRKYACDALTTLRLPDAVILSASENMTGFFVPPVPPSLPGTPAVTNLPPYCRVVGKATPTKNSDIRFEVWLPLGAKYNDRYEQVGNGGFAGVVNYDGLAEGIRRGFATASTDDGHQGFQDASFALGPHDKIVDFGWRSLKQTTDAAKTILHAFYGASAKYAYFFGCSDGGREAMMEVQRFPTDFDGIIAAAPANNWTHQFTALAYDTQAAYDHASFAAILPPAWLSVLSIGVRKQCAGHDGGLPSDLFLTDPRVCAIDWTKIQCLPAQPPATCLSAAQVAAVKAIYGGAKNPSVQIYEGYEPGSEDDAVNTWKPWITGPVGIGPFPGFGLQTFYGEGFFANFIYKTNPYNLMTVDMTSGLADADALAPDLNAMDPDLTAFRAHGGKLIQYAGWADPAVAPGGSIDYYEAVRNALSASYADTQSFYRLFMAPGMAHCGGGPGADAFGNTPESPAPAGQMDADHDVLLALMRWREMGAAPARIVATHYIGDNPASGLVDFQRPLCPYPQLPRYDGTSIDKKSAASFICETRLRRMEIPGLKSQP